MSTTYISISAQVTEGETEGASRYTFSLFSMNSIERQFIIDVPHDESGSTDVWVANSTVSVGDTPTDGFATFTPA